MTKARVRFDLAKLAEKANALMAEDAAGEARLVTLAERHKAELRAVVAPFLEALDVKTMAVFFNGDAVCIKLPKEVDDAKRELSSRHERERYHAAGPLYGESCAKIDLKAFLKKLEFVEPGEAGRDVLEVPNCLFRL